jgi:hypothetical protein
MPRKIHVAGSVLLPSLLLLIGASSIASAQAGCPPDPVFNITSYALDASAPFDDPAISGANGPVGFNASLNVPIGFTFNFYGTEYTSVYITSNGFLTFHSLNAFAWNNLCVRGWYQPSLYLFPHSLIAGYWDAMNPTLAGQITYQTIGTAPNRRFVVHYDNVTLASNGAVENFKIILDELGYKITSTVISTTDGGFSATRGIAQQMPTGTPGVAVSCDSPGSVVAGTSWTCTPAHVHSADLTVWGNSGPNGVLNWTINSNANGAPVVLFASVDPGPTGIFGPGGFLGSLDIGFTSGAFVTVADGVGVFQVANPADVTGASCGMFQTSIALGPAGLPPGFTFYNQGVILSMTSVPPPTNGLFHITNMKQRTTPIGASVTTLGTGCTGFGGGAGPSFSLSALPIIGSTVLLHVTGATPLSPGEMRLSLPPSAPSSTPYGCTNYLQPASTSVYLYFTTDGNGDWSYSDPIPNLTALEGLLVRIQAFIVPSGGPPQASNALELQFGYL